MRLGVNVPNFGPGTTPDSFDEWAELAEELGLDLLAVSDHVVVTPDIARAATGAGPGHETARADVARVARAVLG